MYKIVKITVALKVDSELEKGNINAYYIDLIWSINYVILKSTSY